MKWEPIAQDLLLARLAPPKMGCRVVLDTDTYNEIDDPFALLYALGSPELKLEAIYAAPFHNVRSEGPKDGMEKSYVQILEILELAGENRPVFRGSEKWMGSPDTPVDSPAARDLVERALAMPDGEPLYVATIGAPTNVASAIRIAPEIRKKIVVVWLGGHGLHMPKTDEFNMAQDLSASQTLLDSGVPLVLLPCAGVVSHLLVTLPELEHFLTGKGKKGEYLLENTKSEMLHYGNASRVIWDIATIGWLCNAGWFQSGLIPSPILTENYTYSQDIRRHLIRYVNFLDRNAIITDLFHKI